MMQHIKRRKQMVKLSIRRHRPTDMNREETLKRSDVSLVCSSSASLMPLDAIWGVSWFLWATLDTPEKGQSQTICSPSYRDKRARKTHFKPAGGEEREILLVLLLALRRERERERDMEKGWMEKRVKRERERGRWRWNGDASLRWMETDKKKGYPLWIFLARPRKGSSSPGVWVGCQWQKDREKERGGGGNTIVPTSLCFHPRS